MAACGARGGGKAKRRISWLFVRPAACVAGHAGVSTRSNSATRLGYCHVGRAQFFNSPPRARHWQTLVLPLAIGFDDLAMPDDDAVKNPRSSMAANDRRNARVVLDRQAHRTRHAGVVLLSYGRQHQQSRVHAGRVRTEVEQSRSATINVRDGQWNTACSSMLGTPSTRFTWIVVPPLCRGRAAAGRWETPACFEEPGRCQVGGIRETLPCPCFANVSWRNMVVQQPARFARNYGCAPRPPGANGPVEWMTNSPDGSRMTVTLRCRSAPISLSG